MTDVVLFIVAIIVGAVIIAYSIADVRQERKIEKLAYDELDHRRQLRQAEFDAHAHAVARACLMETYAEIHFPGEGRHD